MTSFIVLNSHKDAQQPYLGTLLSFIYSVAKYLLQYFLSWLWDNGKSHACYLHAIEYLHEIDLYNSNKLPRMELSAIQLSGSIHRLFSLSVVPSEQNFDTLTAECHPKSFKRLQILSTATSMLLAVIVPLFAGLCLARSSLCFFSLRRFCCHLAWLTIPFFTSWNLPEETKVFSINGCQLYSCLNRVTSSVFVLFFTDMDIV